MSQSSEAESAALAGHRSREGIRLGALFAVLYFVQGVGEPVAGLVAQPVRSLLKTWGENAAFIAAFSAAVSIPWSLKPLYGLVSDFLPFAGYRRRSYLILTAVVTFAGFVILYAVRPSGGSYVWFLVLLVAPTVAIAFGDVLVDALMVERGRPLGLTGVLQSIQWTASYAATLLTGVLGGFLAQRGMEYEAFLLCAALALVTFVMAFRYVEEDKQSSSENFAPTWQALRDAARSPTLLSIAAFLFLWNLDPLSTTVVYMHITETLGWSEQFFGYTLSTLAIGCIVGSAAYSLYCRRVSMTLLTHTAIGLGALSQAAYWGMSNRPLAIIIHIVVGLTWMTASLIQLDLAARICPPQAAATVFAVLMALCNIASSIGEWLGGIGYDVLLRSAGDERAFAVTVGVGTAVKVSCWLLFLLPVRWMEGRADPDAPAEHGCQA